MSTVKNGFLRTQCPMCKEVYYVTLPLDGYKKWQEGELIQNAFPNMSADNREKLITGICSECWDKAFGEEE